MVRLIRSEFFHRTCIGNGYHTCFGTEFPSAVCTIGATDTMIVSTGAIIVPRRKCVDKSIMNSVHFILSYLLSQ